MVDIGWQHLTVQRGARVLTVTDVHVSSDGYILTFHDPTLDRTTNGKGAIRSQPWKGVIE